MGDDIDVDIGEDIHNQQPLPLPRSQTVTSTQSSSSLTTVQNKQAPSRRTSTKFDWTRYNDVFAKYLQTSTEPYVPDTSDSVAYRPFQVSETISREKRRKKDRKKMDRVEQLERMQTERFQQRSSCHITRTKRTKGIPAERFGLWLSNLKEEWRAKRAARKLRLDNEEFSPLLLPDAIIDDDFQDALDVLEEPDTFDLDLALIDENYGMSLSPDEDDIPEFHDENSFDLINEGDACRAAEDFISSLPECTGEELEQHVDCSKSITDTELLPVQYAPRYENRKQDKATQLQLAERKAEESFAALVRTVSINEEKKRMQAEKDKSEVIKVNALLTALPPKNSSIWSRREYNRVHQQATRNRKKHKEQEHENRVDELRYQQLSYILAIAGNKQDDVNPPQITELLKRRSLDNIRGIESISVILPTIPPIQDVKKRNRVHAQRSRDKQKMKMEKMKELIEQLERENTLLSEHAKDQNIPVSGLIEASSTRPAATDEVKAADQVSLPKKKRKSTDMADTEKPLHSVAHYPLRNLYLRRSYPGTVERT